MPILQALNGPNMPCSKATKELYVRLILVLCNDWRSPCLITRHTASMSRLSLATFTAALASTATTSGTETPAPTSVPTECPSSCVPVLDVSFWAKMNSLPFTFSTLSTSLNWRLISLAVMSRSLKLAPNDDNCFNASSMGTCLNGAAAKSNNLS
uniref:Uncharacterized protein n=1 Tax=Romanomermis culicivorax TaxID=13658 RepID=A0A915JMI8_ROMCU